MILGTVVDGGAGNGAGCLVSMGCGMAFGAVNNALGFTGTTSAIVDVQVAVQAQINVSLGPFLLGRFLEGHIEAGSLQVGVLMKA